jgi:hypothetical protein
MEIPLIVSNTLIEMGALTPDMIPWPVGKKRYLICTKPKHPNGKRFFQPKLLSNGWWVETHNSMEYQLTLAKKLIAYCIGDQDSEVIIE